MLVMVSGIRYNQQSNPINVNGEAANFPDGGFAITRKAVV